MSSTKRDARIRDFFFHQALPAAEGQVLFPVIPDPAAATYWELRTVRCMSAVDFELSCDSGERFADAFAAIAKPELAALAPALGCLAEQLRETGGQNEEVSPFIYVMF
jgi:hypothetical protein